jgi:hypothetical protein
VIVAREDRSGMAVEFVSEAITPQGRKDAGAMARGEPGLPERFRWRDTDYAICAVTARWKDTSAEGGRAGGDVYLRRHYYELAMDDGSRWTVYCTRQTPKSGSPKARWYLYQRQAARGNADRRHG